MKYLFKKPTVKKVIFQIKFPSLFSMELKVGELQDKIIREFPESSLSYIHPMFLTQIGPEGKKIEPPKELTNVEKVWQFISPKGYRLNVLINSLDISSDLHKSYDNPKAEHRFRDVIESVLEPFFSLTRIPNLNRIGLRYIDECPIPRIDDSEFKKWYNTVLPLKRFSLTTTNEMSFRTVTKVDKYYLMYSENFILIKDKNKMTHKFLLDFDGYAENIPSDNYLNITDKLHQIISDCYFETIKKPAIDRMKPL